MAHPGNSMMSLMFFLAATLCLLPRVSDVFVPTPSGLRPPAQRVSGLGAHSVTQAINSHCNAGFAVVGLAFAAGAAAAAVKTKASRNFTLAAGRRAAESEPAKEVKEEEEPAVPVALGEDGLPLDVEFDDDMPVVAPFAPSEQVGVTEPLGYFDPLGFAKVGEREEFRKLRAAELKHGRVAMLATVGLVGQHWLRLPGFEGAKNTFASTASIAFKPPAVYIFSLIIPILISVEVSIWAQLDEREPGDFGDPLGLNMYTTEMRNRELNNGRFAMFASLGIIAAQLATGKDAVQQLGFS